MNKKWYNYDSNITTIKNINLQKNPEIYFC